MKLYIYIYIYIYIYSIKKKQETRVKLGNLQNTQPGSWEHDNLIESK
jgi:hypothetical protein